MPIQKIKKDIKKHRPIDWFALVVLVSVGIVLFSALSTKIDRFIADMDLEARYTQAEISALQQMRTQLK